ncbi:MAG TPA: phenylacetate--CoA ligase family protein [Desulfobacterales bacterium]|nr:phenylacetate--CoA ligase family protein [Desulfobacterales bacterium]
MPKIFTSSEMLEAGTRQKIETGLNGEVFDIFGCSELKEISWECPAKQGYHINSDWLLVESLESAQANGDGKAPGRLVVTSLSNYAMPLIRYELGDTGRLLQKQCNCGRGLQLMTPALGRSVDYFTLPDGMAVSPYAMTCAIENIEGMAQYQIRQTAMNHVIVSLVPTPDYRDENSAAIRSSLKEVLPGVTIEVNKVATLKQEKNGKFRIVASELNTNPPIASPDE